jgi:mannosylglycerate hydrolase
VHQEIWNRFFLAEEKVDQLINFYKRKIVDSMDTDLNHDRLTAFNLLPYDREEVITTTVISKLKSFKLIDADNIEVDFEVLNSEILDPGLIDRQIVHYGNYDPFIKYTVQLKDTIPAMGYKTYFVTEEASEMQNSVVSKDKVETDFYEITVNQNGTLNIFDKRINKAFRDVLLLENGGDDGDEYDFSPLPNETLIYSDKVSADVNIIQNKYSATIDIQYKLLVPGDLEKRKANVKDSFVDIHFAVTVPNHKPIIEVQLDIDNHARDQRLRALIPTGIASAFSVSDNQFGYIKRDVYDSAMDVWEKENWDERPDSIYPMMSFVGLSDEEHGVSVLTNSTREFEIIGEKYDTIAITLFRGVGFLGKEEMLRRPGRPSGIKLPTPDSQMLGRLSLQFAITTHDGSVLKTNAGRMAKDYLTPITMYNKIPHDAMKLNKADVKTPMSFSLLKEIGTEVVLSTLKKAEKEDQFVLRFYNPTEEVKNASFNWNRSILHAHIANLNEEPGEALEVRDNVVNVKVKVNQVRSILF